MGLKELMFWPKTRLAPKRTRITGTKNRELKLIFL